LSALHKGKVSKGGLRYWEGVAFCDPGFQPYEA